VTCGFVDSLVRFTAHAHAASHRDLAELATCHLRRQLTARRPSPTGMDIDLIPHRLLLADHEDNATARSLGVRSRTGIRHAAKHLKTQRMAEDSQDRQQHKTIPAEASRACPPPPPSRQVNPGAHGPTAPACPQHCVASPAGGHGSRRGSAKGNPPRCHPMTANARTEAGLQSTHGAHIGPDKEKRS
jgi:hypothetical protein